jgi:hypothetical protein
METIILMLAMSVTVFIGLTGGSSDFDGTFTLFLVHQQILLLLTQKQEQT